MSRWTPDEHGCIYDEAGCFARLTPNKAERLASRHNADIDALTAEIQQFRDAYAHDREIMADNVTYIDSYEKRIEVMEATLDAIREVVPEGDNTKWSSWQMVTKIHAILYPKEPING